MPDGRQRPDVIAAIVALGQMCPRIVRSLEIVGAAHQALPVQLGADDLAAVAVRRLLGRLFASLDLAVYGSVVRGLTFTFRSVIFCGPEHAANRAIVLARVFSFGIRIPHCVLLCVAGVFDCKSSR